MNGARLVAALAGPLALLLAGSGIVRWVPELDALSRPARLAAAYLAGAAAVGSAAFLLSWGLGLPLRAETFLLLAAAGVVAFAAGRFRGRRRPTRPRPRVASERGFVLLLAIASVGFVAAAVVDPVVDFDGRMTWGAQARFVHHDRSVLPEALLDERVFAVHPRYPLLLPILQVAAVEIAASDWDDAPVQALYGLFLPALALLLSEGLRRLPGVRSALLGCALVAFVPALSWGLEGGARSTYSDLPLAAFLGAALLLLARRRLSVAGGLAAGLFLGAAVLAKQEGAVLAGALAISGLVPHWTRWRGSARPRWIAAAGYLCALGAWLAWRRLIPNRNDEGYLEGLLAGVPVGALVSRVGGIARGVWATLSDWHGWGLFWLLLPWAAVHLSRGWMRTRIGRLALALLAAQAILILAAYASAPRLDVVAATFGRFAIQATAPLAVLFALSVAEARRRLAARGGRPELA